MDTPKMDAILACRVTGTRLYGKPLQYIDIENKVTVLEYLARYIEEIRCVRRICLAIADNRQNWGLVDIAEKNGWPYVFGDEIDVLDRILKAADKIGSDIVFRITTDCPFIYHEKVDELFESHVQGGYDLSKFSDLPEGTGFSLNNVSALRLCHDKGSERHRSELVNSYIFDNQGDFKIQTLAPEKRLRRPEVRVTVDYPEDLVFCRKVYQALGGRQRLIPVEQIVHFWDSHEKDRRPMEEIGIDWGHGRLWK